MARTKRTQSRGRGGAKPPARPTSRPKPSAKPNAKRRTAAVAPAATAATAASRLARALQVLAADLPNPADESTDYFHGFSAPLGPSVALSPEAFHAALGVGARYQIDLGPADDLFANVEDPENWGDDIAHGFRVLHAVMNATLTDVSVAHARGAGVVRVRMWLFGRADDGSLVGLHSLSTET
jgi:hypothetical protein